MDIQNQVTKTNFSPVFQTFERKENNNVNLNTPNDSVDLYDMSNELKFFKSYAGGGYIYTGKLNGKKAEMKMVIYDNKNMEAEGKIGDKKILITGSKYGEKNIGTYNGKDFDINIDFDKNLKGAIKKMSGTIDGKPFELDFSKQPEIPKDSDTRDIVSTVLATMYNSAFTINGKIAKIVMSEDYNEVEKYKYERKQDKLDKYILPSITAIGGAFLGICSNLITNTLEKGEGKKALKTVNLKKIFNKENIKNLFKKINLKEIEKLIKKLPKVKIK